MNASARAALFFLGTVLMVLGAIVIGQRWSAGEDLEPLAPCVAALFGAGLFGYGLFAQDSKETDCRTIGEAGGMDLEVGEGDS